MKYSGIKRRASSFTPNVWTTSIRIRIRAIPKFHLHYGDLTDSSNLTRILQEVQPDEVYIPRRHESCRGVV
ncbi:GDP-mannose 4,6-dehydratase [Citrobacter braakii]|nr:GDP-mannose 4,6-dehydratase [Citrobacter braakii]